MCLVLILSLPDTLQISIASGRIKFAQGMPVLDAAGKALLGIVFRQVALSSGPTRAQTKGSSGSGSGGGAPRAPHVAAGGATRKRRRRAAELAMMAAPASVIRHFLEDLHTQGR